MKNFCLCLFGFLISNFSVFSQKSFIEVSLADRGFENVGVIHKGSDLYITYENNLFRFEAKGLSEVIGVLMEYELRDFDNIFLLLRSQDIPITLVHITVKDLNAFKAGLIDPIAFASNIVFSFSIKNVDILFEELDKLNSSFYKVDIPMGIALDYQLGDFNAPIRTRFYLDTRVTSSLGTGTGVEFEFRNIVQNDIPGSAISSPTIFMVTQSERLGKNSFVTANLGYLPQGKFGLHTRFRNYLAQEKFYLELFYGITRRGYLDQNWNVVNNRNSDATWQAIFNYRWNKFDTDINFRYGTFYAGDLGYKIQLTRQFHEVFFDLFYAQTDIISTGSFGSAQEGIFGFALTIPFGQSKFMKPKSIRARTYDQFYLLYRYSGLSVSGIDINSGNTLFSDIREFYPQILKKGLIKFLR